MLLFLREDLAEQLVGTAEVKHLLDLSTQYQLDGLYRDQDFPRPVAILLQGRLWLRYDIEQYIKRKEKEHGQQRTSSATR